MRVKASSNDVENPNVYDSVQLHEDKEEKQ